MLHLRVEDTHVKIFRGTTRNIPFPVSKIVSGPVHYVKQTVIVYLSYVILDPILLNYYLRTVGGS